MRSETHENGLLCLLPNNALSWLIDAPEAPEVLAHVVSLLAVGLKLMSDEELRQADHVARMRLMLTAEVCYDFWAWAQMSYIPPGARPIMELHKECARRVMAVRNTEGLIFVPPHLLPMDALHDLAERCARARGSICRSCRLPPCLHVSPCGE